MGSFHNALYTNATRYTILIVVLIWITSNINWGGRNWDALIVYDSKGYYSYLPATFIYGDLNFGFFDEIEQKYYPTYNQYDYRTQTTDGKYVNKYFAGTAVLELPFFIVGHVLSKVAGTPQDGYSKYYAILLNISSLFYLLTGLIYLQKVLQRFSVSFKNQWIVILCIVFGTNAFVYSVADPGMSHIYSFACINALIYYGYKFKEENKLRHYLLFCALLGLIILIRPINILVLLGIPFFMCSVEEFKKVLIQILNLKWKIALGLIIAGLIISIQLLIYKHQTGSWFIYAYKNEGFDFSRPNMINFLLSYRKGYFIYTPIAFISLLGLVSLWKKNKFKFYTLIIFLSILIYVLSSWWCWWYGGSFSSRVMLEFTIFIFVPLAILLESIKSKLKQRLLVGLLVVLVLVCQIQIYQFRHFQIHWSEMNKEAYWDVFLSIDKLLN